MNCCQCQGIEDLFNDKLAAEELSEYRRKGPSKTTRMLVEALKAEGVRGNTLLDIGGGVGAIQHQLVEAGVDQVMDVDASNAYIKAAREEASRRGIVDRVSFQHGNFVDIADQIAPADIVTLDRVVCCFHDMEGLVDLSAARAKRLYGLVYPRYTWWARLGAQVINFFFGLRKKSYRSYIHPTRAVDAIVRSHGLRPRFYAQTLIWQVVVYSAS